MIARTRLASFAMGVLLVAVMTPRATRAQQAGELDDPNLPGIIGPPDLQLYWTQITHGSPQVGINLPEERSNGGDHYIGWNDQGSWIRSEQTGKIYVWNFARKTLTKVYDNEGQIPQATLASMHNFKDPRMLANYKPAPNLPQQSEGPKPVTPDTSRQTAGQAAPAEDPNFPGVFSPPGLNVEWNQSTPGSPSVLIRSPEFLPGQPSRSLSPGYATYIGYNDQGSWLVKDGLIFIWNLKENIVKEVYRNYKEIPEATLATLKNNPYAAAKNSVPQPPAHSEGPHPQTPDTSRQAAFFSGYQPPMGGIYGTAAAIQDGVLTFTRADKTKASYKVVRPKAAQGAPGNTGAWIAMEDGGKGILFTVQSDGTLTGREMPAQLIQMLVQAPAR